MQSGLLFCFCHTHCLLPLPSPPLLLSLTLQSCLDTHCPYGRFLASNLSFFPNFCHSLLENSLRNRLSLFYNCPYLISRVSKTKQTSIDCLGSDEKHRHITHRTQEHHSTHTQDAVLYFVRGFLRRSCYRSSTSPSTFPSKTPVQHYCSSHYFDRLRYFSLHYHQLCRKHHRLPSPHCRGHNRGSCHQCCGSHNCKANFRDIFSNTNRSRLSAP